MTFGITKLGFIEVALGTLAFHLKMFSPSKSNFPLQSIPYTFQMVIVLAEVS